MSFDGRQVADHPHRDVVLCEPPGLARLLPGMPPRIPSGQVDAVLDGEDLAGTEAALAAGAVRDGRADGHHAVDQRVDKPLLDQPEAPVPGETGIAAGGDNDGHASPAARQGAVDVCAREVGMEHVRLARPEAAREAGKASQAPGPVKAAQAENLHTRSFSLTPESPESGAHRSRHPGRDRSRVPQWRGRPRQGAPEAPRHRRGVGWRRPGPRGLGAAPASRFRHS